jgi:hypothetical protein
MLMEMYTRDSGWMIEQTASEYSLMSTAMLSSKGTGLMTYSMGKELRHGGNLGSHALPMSGNFSKGKSRETDHSSGKMALTMRETLWMGNFKGSENTTLQISISNTKENFALARWKEKA